MDESHATLPQLSAMCLGDQARKKFLVNHGYRLPSALDNQPLTMDGFWKHVPQTLFCSATPGKYEMNRLSLQQEPIDASYLHSGLSTDERSNQLRLLQSGQVDVLVGVNCLREGLDLPQVSLVAVQNSDSDSVQTFVYFSSVQWELTHVLL